MQNVHKLDTLTGQPPSLSPMRVLTSRPSVWRRLSARVKDGLAKETTAEVILGATTVLLMLWLFASFSRALQNYTIIPLP